MENSVPDVGKVKASQEQFETLSQFLIMGCAEGSSDTLMEIAAQQLVHLQHYRSLSSAYKELVLRFHFSECLSSSSRRRSLPRGA